MAPGDTSVTLAAAAAKLTGGAQGHRAPGAGYLRPRPNAPCLTKVWLVSSRISQPSVIMRSMARFFRMFSVSLTSSCMILWGQERTPSETAATTPRAAGCQGPAGPGRKSGTEEALGVP